VKFIHGFLICVVIALAAHGAYQLYKQYLDVPFEVSEDVRKDLEAAGIVLGETVDRNGVTHLFDEVEGIPFFPGDPRSTSKPPVFMNSASSGAPPYYQDYQGASSNQFSSDMPSLIASASLYDSPAPAYAAPAYTSAIPSVSVVPVPVVSPAPVTAPTVSVPPIFAGESSHADSDSPSAWYIPTEHPTPSHSTPSSPVPEASQTVVATTTVPESTPELFSAPTSDFSASAPGSIVAQREPDADVSQEILPSSEFKPDPFPLVAALSPPPQQEMSRNILEPMSLFPTPVIIESPESATSPSPVPITSMTSQDEPGFATSRKKRDASEITPVNSMISQFSDRVIPLPPVIEEGIRPEIVARYQAIVPFFESQDSQKLKEAYLQLSELFFTPDLSQDEKKYVGQPLNQVAGGLFFSPKYHVIEPPYTVREGETMESIAQGLQVTPELLWKINGFAMNTAVQPEMQIKVIRGPLEARVYPNTCELVITDKGAYVCRFKIGVGLNYAGQKGIFTVQTKQSYPTYDLGFGLDRIEAGDPNNPLGNRWIQLSQMANNIGIHGTNRPDLVGVSGRTVPGVFFMKNEDVVEICDMLVPGSTVIIER